MSQRVTRSILVRRSHEDVAAFVTDPHQVLPVVPGFARFAYVDDNVDDRGADAEQWDVFLEVGTLHVGGRVLVVRPSANQLEWQSDRGTRHSFSLEVEPVGEHAQVTMEIEYGLSGLLMARISEILARGIVVRHIEAGLEEIRHHLEYGDVIPA